MAKIKRNKKLKVHQNVNESKVNVDIGEENATNVKKKRRKQEFIGNPQRYNLRNKLIDNALPTISAEGKIVFPNPLVVIDRCAETESAISNMSEKYTFLENKWNYKKGNFADENKAAETVSVTEDKPTTIETVTPSTSNSCKMESVESQSVSEMNPPENVVKNTNLIFSFKITANLNDKHRKVDRINLPITASNIVKKKVSIRQKQKVKKVISSSWISSAKFQEILFKDLINVTSSNCLFKNAHFEELDTSPSGRTTPKITLTRLISNSITSPSGFAKWSSKESVTSTSSGSVTDRITPRKLDMVEKFPRISGFECKESTQSKSESSGYHSEQKLSDNSTTSSRLSSPNINASGECERFNLNPQPSRTITIIPSAPQQHQHFQPTSQIAIKRKFDFKTPILPNTKRPPSRRVKEIICAPPSPVRTPVKVTTQQYHSDNDDNDDNLDAISLFAESCLDVDVQPRAKQPLNIQNKSSQPCLKAKPPNLDITVPNSYDRNTKSINFLSAKPIEKMVEIKEVTPPPIPMLMSQNNFVDTSKVNTWIEESTHVSNNFVTQQALMGCLNSLCRYYYGWGMCEKKGWCRYHHCITEEFKNYFRELTEQQLQFVISRMKKFRYLFRDLFDLIISYYKDRNQVDNLIDFIENILKIGFDKTPYIQKVILALKDMGMNFVEAINEILLTHGRKKQSLLDILLWLIVEEGDCLENNWQLMDKLTKFHKDKLDYGVVSEIFKKCCNTDAPRRDFCENIYKDLIIKSHIELDKIDRNLVIKYINLLYHFDFDQYAEQVKQNNGIQDYEVQKLKQNPSITEVSPLKAKDNSANLNSSNASNHSCTIAPINNLNNTDFNNEGDELLDFSYEQEEYPEMENTVESEGDPGKESESEKIEEYHEDQRMLTDPNQADEEEEVEEEYNPEIASADNVLPLYQPYSPRKNNHNYTNSELDTYLDSVNRDIYPTSNYYRYEEQTPIENCNNYNNDDNNSKKPEQISPIIDQNTTPGSIAIHQNTTPTSIAIHRNTTPPSIAIHQNTTPPSIGIEQITTPRTIAKSTTSTWYSPEHINNLDAICNNTFESREIDLPDMEVGKLASSVKQSDLYSILSIMNRSATTNRNKSFVAHTVSALMNMPPLPACKLIVNVFDNLTTLNQTGSEGAAMKNLMKLLAFNILPILDMRKDYAAAIKIINIFALDMDSFIETKCIRHYSCLSTVKLRYIFIFKIYVRDNRLKEALKLLKSSNLNLFQNLSKEKDQENVDYKIRILTEFIEISLEKDLHIARETILYLMLNMDLLRDSIDLVKYLNDLLVKLLNSLNFKSQLLGLIDNILNSWHKYLKHSIMRALLIELYGDLCGKKLIDFFNLCIELEIYEMRAVNNNSLCIPTNLLPEEIHLFLQCQFSKIYNSNFPLNNLLISVDNPIPDDEYSHQLKILTNSLVNPKNMITRILNVFAKYPHFPPRDRLTISPSCITIPINYLKYYIVAQHQGGAPPVVNKR